MLINKFLGPYKFLSNFYACPIVYKGVRYPSSEHAYQAEKFTDFELKRRIASIHHPGKAKKLAYFLMELRPESVRPDWEEIKISIMTEILKVKFENETMARKLLDTGDDILIEKNGHGDSFWGVSNGSGYNHLGKILMRIRSDLKAPL